MQLHFEAPSLMEAVAVTATSNGMDIDPLTVRGQHLVRAGYITANGANGTSSRAMILFNGNTGDFTVQRIDGEPVTLAFDKLPTEFVARRASAKERANKKRQKTPAVTASTVPGAAS